MMYSERMKSKNPPAKAPKPTTDINTALLIGGPFIIVVVVISLFASIRGLFTHLFHVPNLVATIYVAALIAFVVAGLAGNEKQSRIAERIFLGLVVLGLLAYALLFAFLSAFLTF